VGFAKSDFLGAGAIFLLVFLSTFPVVIPFIFVANASHALRLSNGVAILMLFWGGVAYGRYAGVPKWVMGLIMVVVGLILVGITISLGG
jgi:VIT1/CCC1 family predicted Fe2+/Mn2+ transporter